jgi:hypothetical protein
MIGFSPALGRPKYQNLEQVVAGPLNRGHRLSDTHLPYSLELVWITTEAYLLINSSLEIECSLLICINKPTGFWCAAFASLAGGQPGRGLYLPLSRHPERGLVKSQIESPLVPHEGRNDFVVGRSTSHIKLSPSQNRDFAHSVGGNPISTSLRV